MQCRRPSPVMPVPYRVGGEGIERRCVRSAASLEGTGVLMTVITVMTAATIRQGGTGE
jgi:hypothetical protein